MKRLGILAIALLVLLSISAANVNAAASVGTWHTYREDISCASGYGDIDYTFWYNGSTNASLNVTLPCNIANLSQTLTNFTILNTGVGALYNLTVNGVAVNSSDTLTQNTENVSTLAQMVTAGVTNTDEYLNFEFDCNQTTTTIGINITGTDVTFGTTFLALITIKEKDVTRLPYVGLSSTTSIHAVNNSFNISNSTLETTLVNAVFNLTFPSHKVSTPTTTFEAPTIAANGSYQNYTQYQKYGPYVYDVEEDVDGRTHEVTVRVKANEVLTSCVQWELDPDDDVYDEAFDTIDEDTLAIEYNSADFDDWTWDDDDGVLTLEDFTTREGFGNNKFVFTWTEPAAVTPAAPATVQEQIIDFFTSDVSGIPVWCMIVAAIAIIALIGYFYVKPKSRKKKR